MTINDKTTVGELRFLLGTVVYYAIPGSGREYAVYDSEILNFKFDDKQLLLLMSTSPGVSPFWTPPSEVQATKVEAIEARKLIDKERSENGKV